MIFANNYIVYIININMDSELDIEQGAKLKRAFSLQDAALFGVGGAVGSGILFAAAGGTAYAGPAILLSWIIASIMIVIVTLPFAEFSSMAPRGGISARIAYYSYGNFGGFMSGWSLFLWAVLIPPIEAVAVSQYASYYLPALYDSNTKFLTIYGILLSIGLTILFVLLNVFGVRVFGKFNTGLTWLKVASVVAIIIIVPLIVFNPANFSTPSFILPVTKLSPYGAAGIVIAIPASGILFSFGGYRQVADMAGEIKNPKRNLPIAIGITLIVQSVFYVLMSIVTVGAVNWKGSNITTGNWGAISSLGSPLATILNGSLSSVTGSSHLVLQIVIVLILVFAIFAPMGTFGVYLTGSSRIIFGFTRENSLPKVLGQTDKRGVPIFAIILVAVIGDLFLLPLPNWYSLVDFVVSAAAVNFAIVASSIPVMRRLYPDKERSYKVPAFQIWSPIAFISATLLIYWSTWPTVLYAMGAELTGIVVFLIFGVLINGKGTYHFKNGIWMPFYVIGMIILSYIGSAYTGGLNILQYPMDFIVVVIYGVAFYFISLLSAPKKEVNDFTGLIERAPKEMEQEA
jgi:amino acid transporter